MTAPHWQCPNCQIPLAINAARVYCSHCAIGFTRHEGIWDNDQPWQPLRFTPQSRCHLEALEQHRHFWFAGRHELFLHLLARLIPAPVTAAIELGCGNGALLPVLQNRAKQVTGVDAYRRSLLLAQQQAPKTILLRADLARRLPLAANQFGLLCAFDVLEHLDPAAFLGESRRIARDNGLLLLSVPAFPSLWSCADELAGHRCRYRLPQIERELANQGWRLLGHTYYQCLLFPLLWLSRKLGRRRRLTVERRPPTWLGRCLGAINRAEARWFAARRLPFGSSLVAWAQPL